MIIDSWRVCGWKGGGEGLVSKLYLGGGGGEPAGVRNGAEFDTHHSPFPADTVMAKVAWVVEAVHLASVVEPRLVLPALGPLLTGV